MPRCRVVELWACTAGSAGSLNSLRNEADRIPGLAASFLANGALAVIDLAWPVHDIVKALVCEQYGLMRRRIGHRPEALKQALCMTDAALQELRRQAGQRTVRQVLEQLDHLRRSAAAIVFHIDPGQLVPFADGADSPLVGNCPGSNWWKSCASRYISRLSVGGGCSAWASWIRPSPIGPRQDVPRLCRSTVKLLGLLLRHSLAQVAKPYGEQNLLDAFRFETLDDAVDWCLERFATGTLAPRQLSPSSRSWRLFTQASFWLSQREGTAGFRRKMQELEAACRRDSARAESPEPGEEPVPDLDVQRLKERLARTLSELRDSHLSGSRHLVAPGHGGTALPMVRVASPELAHESRTKKDRSVRAHDALFRFACLFRKLILHEKDTAPSQLAVSEWLFSPCRNAPPYRRTEEEIAAALPLKVPKEKRAIQRLRREGVSRAHPPVDQRPRLADGHSGGGCTHGVAAHARVRDQDHPHCICPG